MMQNNVNLLLSDVTKSSMIPDRQFLDSSFFRNCFIHFFFTDLSKTQDLAWMHAKCLIIVPAEVPICGTDVGTWLFSLFKVSDFVINNVQPD